MKHVSPPTLALKLLDYLLPDSVKDDITGDLTEEFNQSTKTPFINQVWFWQQTTATCYRYNMNTQNILSLVLAICTLFTFYALVIAIMFLSNADDTNIFDNAYWSNGTLHLFFLEAEFWQRLNGQDLANLSLMFFINVPSFLWFIFSCTVLFGLDKKYQLNLKNFATLAFILISLPYCWGVVYFNLYDVPLKQSGPIIAMMWISIIYLILPFSYGLIRKIRSSAMTISA